LPRQPSRCFRSALAARAGARGGAARRRGALGGDRRRAPWSPAGPPRDPARRAHAGGRRRLSLFDEIRAAAAEVTRRARSVAIDEAALECLAAAPAAEPARPPRLQTA